MRIAQLANFHAATSGGLRTVVDRLRAGYAAAGHEVALVVPGAEPAWEETAAGVVVTVPGVRVGGPYRVIVRRRDVADALARFRPDRVEVSDKLTLGWVGEWARARRVPSVLFSHERIDAILADRFPRRFPLVTVADRRNAALVARFDQVVCTSAFARAEYDRIGATNVRTVPLGVDLGVFRPDPEHALRSGGPLQVVTVGRLSREKRPAVAIDVLRHLLARGVDARLTLVGDGPLRDRLVRRAAGLPVTFAGHVGGRPELAALVRAADVCLAPCPADTFGMAVLEALACGVPAVVPVVGGPAELVRDGAGCVVDDDVASLAGGVRTIAAGPAEPLRRAARRRAEAYPWRACVEAMLAAHDAPLPAGVRAA